MRVICTLMLMLCAMPMSICATIDSTRAVNYARQARDFALEGQIDSTAFYHQQALCLFQQLDDLESWISVNKNLAKTFRDQKHQPEIGLEYLHNAMPEKFGRRPQTEKRMGSAGLVIYQYWIYIHQFF